MDNLVQGGDPWTLKILPEQSNRSLAKCQKREMETHIVSRFSKVSKQINGCVLSFHDWITILQTIIPGSKLDTLQQLRNRNLVDDFGRFRE